MFPPSTRPPRSHFDRVYWPLSPSAAPGSGIWESLSPLKLLQPSRQAKSMQGLKTATSAIFIAEQFSPLFWCFREAGEKGGRRGRGVDTDTSTKACLMRVKIVGYYLPLPVPSLPSLPPAYLPVIPPLTQSPPVSKQELHSTTAALKTKLLAQGTLANTATPLK